MSRELVRAALRPQKARHLSGGSSPREKSSERRPTKPLDLWMFVLIQAETLPATTRMSLSCLESWVSHAVFRVVYHIRPPLWATKLHFSI